MPVHKLANGPITLTIAAVTESEGQYGPQVKFTGQDGMEVYVNKAPADRGLGRLNLTAETAVGQTIKFQQVKKDGKTFTNMDLAAPGSEGIGAPATATTTTAAMAAPTPRRSVEDLDALYEQCLGIAMKHLVGKFDDAGIAYDGATIVSATATLFIQATK
jgi:hypothetical protein